MDKQIEGTDRYEALGITPNGCKGQCEGTGVVPVFMVPAEGIPEGHASGPSETDPELVRRWQTAEAAEHATDGYHFVTCPTCEARSPGGDHERS